MLNLCINLTLFFFIFSFRYPCYLLLFISRQKILISRFLIGCIVSTIDISLVAVWTIFRILSEDLISLQINKTRRSIVDLDINNSKVFSLGKRKLYEEYPGNVFLMYRGAIMRKKLILKSLDLISSNT